MNVSGKLAGRLGVGGGRGRSRGNDLTSPSKLQGRISKAKPSQTLSEHIFISHVYYESLILI